MSLNFQTVPLVESGLGKISVLSDICNKLNIKKPLIITDQGLFKLGFIEKIEKNLTIKNIFPSVYNKVLADPPESNIPADLLLCSFNSSQSSPMEQSTSKLQSPELFNAFACL